MARRSSKMRAETRPSAQLVCDLLVIGSGAGGLSAAVTAAWHGLKVIVAEKEPVLGGTTAWSGGWMWTPRNPLAQRAGIVEDSEGPRAYLRHVLGNNFNEAKVNAFLEAAPHMVAFFEKNTAVQFELGLKIPDTYGNAPGAGIGADRLSRRRTTHVGWAASSSVCASPCARRRSWA
jgi:succinate dehydrogenase/fumarate reductase flavoprotein subunit